MPAQGREWKSWDEVNRENEVVERGCALTSIGYGVINDGGAPGRRSGDGACLPAQLWDTREQVGRLSWCECLEQVLARATIYRIASSHHVGEHYHSHGGPLHDIARDPPSRPIIDRSRPGVGVAGQALHVLKRPVPGEQVGDDQDAEAVGAEDRRQLGVLQPPLEHESRGLAESCLRLPRAERNRGGLL